MRSLLLTATLAAAPTFELDGNELKTAPIQYEPGKPTLSGGSDEVLDHVKAYLDAKPAVTTLRVEVHSDSRGSDAFNQRLTEARAAAVVTALVKRGVSCARLIAVAPNDTAEGRARNSRTTFVNAALRGKPIGGQALDGGGVVAKVPVCL